MRYMFGRDTYYVLQGDTVHLGLLEITSQRGLIDELIHEDLERAIERTNPTSQTKAHRLIQRLELNWFR